MLVSGPTLGQISVIPPAADSDRLDGVAQSILGRPDVLVDLGITEMQLARVRLRSALAPVKDTLRNSIAARKAKQPGTDDMVLKAMDMKWTIDSDMKIADLTPLQKKRVHQLALQLAPHYSLLTSETRYALGISLSQQSKLEKLAEDRQKATLEVFGKVMRGTMEKHKNLLQGDQIKTLDEDGGESALAAMEAFEKFFPEIIEKMYAANTPVIKKANEESLRLLTPAQRKVFKQLQGKPMKT